MAQIRQEINILDHLEQINSTARANLKEIVQLDTTQYNGTVTYYFEVEAQNAGGGGGGESLVVTLRRLGTTTDDATITFTADAATLTRSASFTPPAGQTSYFVSAIDATLTDADLIKSARIVIIQNATTLTDTETQVEIGNYNLTRTAESATILTNPKYWKYTAANWDGTKTFYAEAVYDSGDMDTISVYLYTCTDITAPSWSSAVTIVSAATTTTPTRTRVAFTPVDGNWYTIFSLNGSMDNHDIYRAGIVVQQNDVPQSNIVNLGDTADNVYGGSGTEEQHGFLIAIGGSAITLDAISLPAKKTSSPTDNLYVEILTGSISGTVVATSDNVAASSLTTSYAWTRFEFATPYSLSASTTYYFHVVRSGARDTSNFCSIQHQSDGTLSQTYTKASGAWSSAELSLVRYKLHDTAPPTKLEPQYLLANTLFAAGTALQTFLTNWDSTEWNCGAGSIAYYFQAEAANGSTSDVTLEQADGGGTVTNSTLTNIDNAQISVAMTMPGNENLDTKATTNAGDVAAARILVAYVFSAAATAAITGTMIASVTEADIVTGGKTVIITLTGDTWIADISAQRQNIINGHNSAQSETNGWQNEVRAKQAVGEIVRTSDTVVTNTVAAQAAYNITATETITVTIPATALTGNVTIVATPTFTISPTGGVVIATGYLTPNSNYWG